MKLFNLKLSLISSLLVLSSIQIYGQNDIADSLWQLLQNSKDTVKMRHTAEYGYALRTTNPAKGLEYIKKAISLADFYKKNISKGRYYNWAGNLYLRLNEYDNGIKYYKFSEHLFLMEHDTIGAINCYTGMANAYGYKGDYKNSELFSVKAIEWSKKINYEKGLAYNYSNMAIIYGDRGEYSTSIEYLHKGIEISERMGNTIETANNLMNIAVIYQQIGDLKKAEENVRKALIKFREAEDPKGISRSYYNLSALLYNKYEIEKICLDTAKRYLDSAIIVAKNVNDLYLLSDCYTMKCDFALIDSNYQEVINYGLESMNIKKTIEDNFGLADVYRKLGIAYRYSGELVLSEQMLGKAIEMLREQGFRNSLYRTYYQMAQTKNKMGKFEEAFIYMDLHASLKDTCDNEENQQRITEMQKKYETEKNEKEIELLSLDNKLKQSENEKQRSTIIYMLIGLVIVIIFSVLLFRLFRQKRAANKVLAKQNLEIAQQKEEIEAQRDEIEVQRDTVMEQKEQIEEIHGELKSSILYAQRIQKAVLFSDEYAKEVLGDHFIFFRPKDVVSGDFYWFARKGEKIIIAVADCTGHGVPGGFMSMLGISFLNEISSNERVGSPSGILNEIRNYVISSLQQQGVAGEQKDGMDMSIVILDRKTGILQFAGANNGIYIFRKMTSSLEHYKPDKMPVAIHSRMNDFCEHHIKVEENDELFMYTDGFPDQFGGPVENDDGKKFKYRQFEEMLKDVAALNTEQQKTKIENVFEKWKSGYGKIYDQTDDVTVLGVKIY